MSSGKWQLVEIKTNGSCMIFQSEFQIFQFSLPAAPNTDLAPLISRAVSFGVANRAEPYQFLELSILL